MVVTVRRRTGARNPNLPMSKVTIQKTGHAFEVSEGETVLAAALAAGIRCVVAPGPMTRHLEFEGAWKRVESLAHVTIKELMA